MNRAVIDVGTNSVKILVARVEGLGITPLHEDSKQTRLGSGFYETHLLQPDRIAKTAEAVAAYAERARSMKAQSIRVIGTSAARDALNAEALITAIQKSSGLKMVVLSGEMEADWAFHGVITDPQLTSLPLLILDVGGGSTEFIVGENSVPIFRNSYHFGTVRLFEKFRPSDLPGLQALEQCREWIRQFLEENLSSALVPALQRCSQFPVLISTGGSSTILARMHGRRTDFDREQIESARLSLDWVREQSHSLWQMSLADRQRIPGLPPKRADVILTGIAIYQQIMEQFGFSELRVSTRGLRYSALERVEPEVR